jgi:6-pyruvoyltetrahydropterin/6-carboxytetrahydropterin synthase
VFLQKLRTDFCSTGDTKCACRHNHGHQGHVHIFVEGEDLNPQGMVCDFKELGFMKDFLDDYLDHKFIVASHDPLYYMLVDSYIDELLKQHPEMKVIHKVAVCVKGTDVTAGHIFDTTNIADCPLKEYVEGLFIVNFVPTSENLAAWLHGLAQAKLSQIDVKVRRVDFHETPKSCATYME